MRGKRDHPKTPTARSFQSATTASDFMTTTASSTVSRVGRNSSRRGYSPLAGKSRRSAVPRHFRLASQFASCFGEPSHHPSQGPALTPIFKARVTGEIGLGVSLRGTNPEPLMSALGQKQTLNLPTAEVLDWHALDDRKRRGRRYNPIQSPT